MYINVRKAESRKAGYMHFELTSILDSLNGFTAQIFYIMRSHAHCFLFVKTFCCEFNLWLCVFRCYVGQSKKDTVAIPCYCHSCIGLLGFLRLALSIVDGKVGKVLCVLNRFRQN